MHGLRVLEHPLVDLDVRVLLLQLLVPRLHRRYCLRQVLVRLHDLTFIRREVAFVMDGLEKSFVHSLVLVDLVLGEGQLLLKELLLLQPLDGRVFGLSVTDGAQSLLVLLGQGLNISLPLVFFLSQELVHFCHFFLEVLRFRRKALVFNLRCFELSLDSLQLFLSELKFLFKQSSLLVVCGASHEGLFFGLSKLGLDVFEFLSVLNLVLLLLRSQLRLSLLELSFHHLFVHFEASVSLLKQLGVHRGFREVKSLVIVLIFIAPQVFFQLHSLVL